MNAALRVDSGRNRVEKFGVTKPKRTNGTDVLAKAVAHA